MASYRCVREVELRSPIFLEKCFTGGFGTSDGDEALRNTKEGSSGGKRAAAASTANSKQVSIPAWRLARR